MYVMRAQPVLRSGDRWESDRCVCVEIRALSGPLVIMELVGKQLGRFAMQLDLFVRIFPHLVRPGTGDPSSPKTEQTTQDGSQRPGRISEWRLAPITR